MGSKRSILIAVVLIALLGCATSEVLVPQQDGTTVTYKQSIIGRGCMAATTAVDGSIDIIVQQDGSSDWAGIRIIPELARTAIVALFGSRDPTPSAVSGPSDISGCKGLLDGSES